METVEVAWGETISSAKIRRRKFEVYGGETFWREEWFPWEPLPKTLEFALTYRDELVARYANVATDADGVLGEIARGICGPKVAEFFVSDFLEAGDMDAKDKALAFGVPEEIWDSVLARAVEMGAGE